MSSHSLEDDRGGDCGRNNLRRGTSHGSSLQKYIAGVCSLIIHVVDFLFNTRPAIVPASHQANKHDSVINIQTCMRAEIHDQGLSDACSSPSLFWRKDHIYQIKTSFLEYNMHTSVWY